MVNLGHARRHPTLAAITSVAAASLLSSVSPMSARVPALPTQVYATAVGEILPIELDRWISLRANTNTGLTVIARDEIYDVVLDRGEVLFAIEHESPRALRVVVGNMVVSARAASFCVRVRDSRTMDVLVSEGLITVGTTQVSERQIAMISPEGMRLRDLAEEDVARRLEWMNGRIAFAGESLAEAVAEFNRYNKRKLVIADRAISLIPIGGQFRVKDVPSFVAALRPLGVRATSGDEDGIRLFGATGRD